jgi:hypothetical protein
MTRGTLFHNSRKPVILNFLALIIARKITTYSTSSGTRQTRASSLSTSCPESPQGLQHRRETMLTLVAVSVLQNLGGSPRLRLWLLVMVIVVVGLLSCPTT